MKKEILILLTSALLLSSCQGEKEEKVEKLSGADRPKIVEESKSLQKDEAGEAVEKKGELKKFQAQYYEYLDTVTDFTAYAKDEKEFEKYKSILEEELERYNKLYNTYESFEGVNNVYTINEKAGVEPVEVDQDIIDLIKEGKDRYKKTGGDIDIAMGSVLKIRHQYRDEAEADPDKARVPDQSLLEEAGKHKEIDAIEINEDKKTVFIKDKDVQIDVGAIAKGFAVQKTREKLEEAGMTSGIISVGGDVTLIGENPTKDSGKYSIAIQDPNLTDNYPAVVEAKDTAVVTSGDYQRYYEVDGVRYHHIIDPKTLQPSRYFKSVTVIGKDIGEIDAISTALFVKSYDDGLDFIKDKDVEVMWIDQDNKIIKTEGFNKYER